MSSVVPKSIRQKMAAKRPTNFKDVDPRVQTVCKAVSILLNKDCRLTGSYHKGIPGLDSDIDISLEKLPSKPIQKRAADLAALMGAKIDLNTSKGGFKIE